MNPDQPVTPTAPAPRVGKVRASIQLTKSAWRVLKLDKELLALPVLSIAAALFTLMIYVGIVIGGALLLGATFSPDTNTTISNYVYIPIFFIGSVLVTYVANFFGAALIYGATERFRGGDPTVGSSIAGARRHAGPLFWYSVMMTTVGLVLQAIQDRVPLAGKIAVWLLNGAWSIANAFALPVIVLSDAPVKPFDATRQSVAVVKRVWGEGVVLSVGVGLIGFFAVLLYMVIAGGVAALIASISHLAALNFGLVIVGIIGFFWLLLVLTALGSIIKAALYHYATTGEAVETFNKDILHAAFTRKKARALFS
jgi:hypothetical protein